MFEKPEQKPETVAPTEPPKEAPGPTSEFLLIAPKLEDHWAETIASVYGETNTPEPSLERPETRLNTTPSGKKSKIIMTALTLALAMGGAVQGLSNDVGRRASRTARGELSQIVAQTSRGVRKREAQKDNQRRREMVSAISQMRREIRGLEREMGRLEREYRRLEVKKNASASDQQRKNGIEEEYKGLLGQRDSLVKELANLEAKYRNQRAKDQLKNEGLRTGADILSGAMGKILRR